jgi:hypothetical protein
MSGNRLLASPRDRPVRRAFRWGRSLWRRQPLLRAGFFTAALLFLMADDGISADELQCEIAVNHLIDCCPDLPPSQLACTHGGCDSTLRPDLPLDRSACIQQRTCDELVQLGACDPANWQLVAAPDCAPACSAKVPPCQ